MAVQVLTSIGDGVNDSSGLFHGLSRHHSSTSYWVTASNLFGTGIRTINRSDGTLGAADNIGSWSDHYIAYGGICLIGTDYYLLGQDNDRSGDWYLYQVSSGGSKTAERRVGGSNAFHGVLPRLVSNGSQVGMVWIPNSGDLMLRWFNTTLTSTVGSDITLKSSVGQQDIGGAVCGQSGTDDLGTGLGTRVLFVSLANSSDTATKNIMAWSGVTTSAATRQSTYDKARAQGKSVNGLAWDSVNGRIVSVDVTGKLYHYSKYVVASSIQAAFSFTDQDTGYYPGTVGSMTTIVNSVDVSGTASSTHETALSPTTTVTIPAGSWPHIECSPPPDDRVTNSSLVDKANRIGLYWNVGGAPKRYGYLGVSGVSPYSSIRTYGATIASGVPAGDTTPTGSTTPGSDFTGAQVPQPGRLKSAALRADGKPMNDIDGAGNARLDGLIPPGMLMPYAAAGPPAGWLICDGTAVSRSTYVDLWNVIGTGYGAGNGTTTFNLPDLRDRAAIGRSGTKAIGTNGGSATHTISTGEMPSHTHDQTIRYQANGVSSGGQTVIRDVGGVTGASGSTGTAHSSSAGSGSAMDIQNPYVAVTWLIKA